ncbi:MAG TPA: ATP-dependent protease ATPase subunit HslU [Phycisphaerae bacterium]|nr:ATP-dependent protease ATPase subunit HslU [Phycisphaerae bacterium]HPM23360.1 ATP-dependent protease ATPase subunit HslU [Phycisphaerae bacterium]
MTELTPRQIVAALDRYIIGQEDAKRAVAIAIRNRWRRLQLPKSLRNDVCPKNILMIGPTGVGKTEIARRLAQLVAAPFIKVEATKFTEVGYVGRDVDSIVRDLVERAVAMERERAARSVRERAVQAAEDRVLDQLLPGMDAGEGGGDEQAERRQRTREKLRQQLQAGGLAERSVDVHVDERMVPSHVMATMGLDQMGPEFDHFLEKIIPSRGHRRRMSVPEALELMTQQEIDRLIDQDALHHGAIRHCEESGMVFLDELDKICGSGLTEGSGPEVSRSGVQRDLLPLVEGTSISTRYGMVRTDHILFIAAGAFTQARPSDLMPELQGRFPLRVELSDLAAEDYYRILTEPENALIKQQVALMQAEGVTLKFTDEAIVEMAQMAFRANQILENIGARRLYTIVEKVVEEIAFNASDAANKDVTIDVDYVRMRLADILADEERSQYEL